MTTETLAFISFIAAAISAVGLNVKAVREDIKTRELQLLDSLFDRIIKLEEKQPPQDATEESKKD